MARDPITFDPVDPPGGASDAELLLWGGYCPWCAVRAAFVLDDEGGTAWTCQNCGCRFEGLVEDISGITPTRSITALWAEGDPAKRSDPPVDLPTLEA